MKILKNNKNKKRENKMKIKHYVKYYFYVIYCTIFNNDTLFESIVRKRLHGEVFSPSFSARNIFCKSRFRLDETSNHNKDNYMKDDTYEDPDISYSHNDSKRNVLLKVCFFLYVYSKKSIYCTSMMRLHTRISII